MSLRDRFRSRHSGEDDEPVGAPGSPGATPGDGAPEPIDFRPRLDGSYVWDAGGGISLRFAPSSVQETDEAHTADGPATGEYTSSGRFVVQRRFGRPIVYTVLAVVDDGFTARRTDTNVGGAATTADFRFRPTAEAAAGT